MLKLPHFSPALFFTKTNHLKRPISTITTASTTPTPSHDHIAHLILEQKSPIRALQTFRWASQYPSFTHTQATYRALIHKLCSFRAFNIAQNLLDEMPGSIGSPPDDDIFITLARGFARARMIKQVIRVLDMVRRFGKVPSLKLYNAILDVLVKEDIDIAREFYRKKMRGNGDDYTYGILMKGLCLTNRIGDGFKLLQVMKTRGVSPCTVVYNTLIHGLCKNGKVGRARSLMSEMAEPNDVSFNIMISAYCREDNLVQALVMLEKSFSIGFVPDDITVTKVVELLCKNGRVMEAAEVLERVESKGGKVDVVAYNTLIKGICRLGKVKMAHRVIEEMEMKGCLANTDTYNALIAGLCDSGMLDLALDIFDEMKRVGLDWSFSTYDTLLYGLFSAGRVEDGFKVLELMEESKEGCEVCISPYNSVIYGLYKEKRISEALEYLKKMERMFPRAVDRSLKILSFTRKGNIEEAKKVYDQMIWEGDLPSALIFANLVHGFCRKDGIKEAFELLNEMVRRGYFPVSSTFNAIIGGLCRLGKTGRALELLEDMRRRGCSPDSESYSLIISAYCGEGDFQNGLMLFLQMVEKGLVPDYCTWNALVLHLFQEIRWLGGKKMSHVNTLMWSIMEH